MLTAILGSLFNLLILTPFFFLARLSNKGSFYLRSALAFVFIYLISNALTHGLAISLFQGQKFNWVGKGATTLFLIFCAYLLRAFGKEQFGLTRNVQWEGSRPILIICALYFLLRAGLYYFSGEASAAIDPETVLFQGTLPGIHEELLYRGLLLGLLSELFARPTWKFANVAFGWPAVLTSLLFGLDHGIRITDSFGLDVNYFNILRPTLTGFLLALLVQRTKSILPAVIYHNLLNLISNH
jgi:membrane protease YdiL (CAAX protease family)